MFKLFNRNESAPERDNPVDIFIETEQSLHGLPELSSVERVQLDHDIAISHLYHSSKIEGTTLNTERLTKAINA
jgi:hypothetical protein